MTEKEIKLLDTLNFDADEIVFAAFRYYLGRETISACLFAERLAGAMRFINKYYVSMIEDEIDNAIRNNRAGNPNDVEAWTKVLKAIKKNANEKRRGNTEADVDCRTTAKEGDRRLPGNNRDRATAKEKAA